jgi:hypothetical protein
MHVSFLTFSCIDKEYNGTANSSKRHGDNCEDYRKILHPGEVQIPITHILGGNCHDVSFEACISNYFHRHEIVEWLLYCLALPENKNILQRALFTLLTSVEMIAQLRIGAIFFISIIVPMRWLAGNTHLLAQREW